ncbi:MAG: Na/Pi symporter [Planctomycetota bacterium]
MKELKMGHQPAMPTELSKRSTMVRLLQLLIVLAIFFIAISLMGGALKLLTKSYVKELLEQATSNPVVGLLLGILTTSIIQSSSTTTTIVVTLTAAGTISLGSAVPIIMGANIGTTVTNTLVSLAHIKQKQEFQKALAASTVHDFFNIMVTCILFPLEVAFGILQKSAIRVQEFVVGADFGKVSGLKGAIKPIVSFMLDNLGPTICLILSLILLFMSLTLMVKIMRAIFIHKMARVMDRVLFKNAVTAFIVGIIFTILVQSSSVTTSLVVPLVGAGILTLRQIFPYTLGANIGTTITAFLAALAFAAGAEGEAAATAGLGLTVAIVHLLFNIFGIVLVYPFKAIPIWMAEWLGRAMTISPKRAALFILLYVVLHVAPLAMFIFM